MITVLGASGFVGSHVVAFLQSSGLEYQAVARRQQMPAGDLGHVIYCIGVTSDFRQRPYDAVEAHVCALVDLVRNASFESILYLSSTRLYAGRIGVAHEDDDITVNPLRFEDIYNISKAMGESIVLSLGAKGRVARLSNVYGRGQTETFLASVVTDAKTRGAIVLRSAPESARDYVSAADVAEVLVNIAMKGRERIYNVAGGVTLTNGEVAAAIARHTGCSVSLTPGAMADVFPRIDNERIRSEFGFKTKPLMEELPALLMSSGVESGRPARIDRTSRPVNTVIARDAQSLRPGRPLSTSTPDGFAILSDAWLDAATTVKFPYTFTWLGRPVIQFPNDLLRLQELVYRVQPDVIVETGIAHGGSLIFYASLCKVLERGRVIGIDVEIRSHNRVAIEANALAPLITMFEGSSTDPAVVNAVRRSIAPGETVLLVLDSNHTKAHVLGELEAYASLVSPGAYVVAMDGHVMEVAAGSPRAAADWSTNNPNAAVRDFALVHPEFVLEKESFLFNESDLTEPVSGFSGGILKRLP